MGPKCCRWHPRAHSRRHCGGWSRTTPSRSTQSDRLDAIYAHRNELAHDLIRFIVDPDSDLDVELLIEAIETLKQLHRFWIDVEIGIGGFVLPDGSKITEANAEDVTPLSLTMLQKCLDAYLDGLPQPEKEPAA